MRVRVGSVAMAIVAVAGAVVLALMSSASSVVALAARTSVLIMGGSGDPLTTEQDGIEFVEGYTQKAIDNFVGPASNLPWTGIPGPGTDGYNPVAVITPAQFYPDSPLTFDESVALGLQNLHNCVSNTSGSCTYNEDLTDSDAPRTDDVFVVVGFSQSATIATFEKRALAATYAEGAGPEAYFLLLANGNRPNGGFLARGPQGLSIPKGFTFGGVTFSGPTPTDTQYQTTDFAIQYGFWADQPLNPLNPLAWLNAKMGQEQLHPYYIDQSLDDPGIIDQGQYGDTSYYLAATDLLPLLRPVAQIPVVGEALADMLDAPLRVIVEAAYDRTTSPGEPTSWNIFYLPDPIEFAVNLAIAIPTGLDNAIEDITGVRVFGTERPGPYGVGGPDVTWLNPPEETADEPAADTAAAAAAPESSATAQLAAAASTTVSDSDAAGEAPPAETPVGDEAPDASETDEPADIKADEGEATTQEAEDPLGESDGREVDLDAEDVEDAEAAEDDELSTEGSTPHDSIGDEDSDKARRDGSNDVNDSDEPNLDAAEGDSGQGPSAGRDSGQSDSGASTGAGSESTSTTD